MTPEGKVKAEIKKYLDSLGQSCWHFSPMMMGYGRKGIPDIVGCYKGHMFTIEVKAPGKMGTVTPWQLREANALKAAGAVNILADTAKEINKCFEDMDRRFAI